jgi:hypothetical protein
MEVSIVRKRISYVIAALLIVGFLIRWILQPPDLRQEFDVVGLNIRSPEISDAKASYGDFVFQWGWLSYGDTSSYSGVYVPPPSVIRVRWKLEEKAFDRTIAVFGSVPKYDERYGRPDLFIQIDPICGRVKADWKSASENTSYPGKDDAVDCSRYEDMPTPQPAKP